MHAVSVICATRHTCRPGARIRAFLATALLAAFSLLAASANAQGTNSVPFINQPLQPTSAAPGGAAFTLSVTGTGFVSGSVVNWNGSARTTTFVSSSKLTASILSTDIATAGTAQVTVVSPAPGGGTSNVDFFPILASSTSVAFSATTSTLTAPANPVAVVVGDINKDGKMDMVVADDANNSVSIFLGNGDGTFQTRSDIAVVGFPIDAVLADVNNDGNLDIILVDQYMSQVSVLLGNGDGTFKTHVDYATGKNPQVVAVGDFNGDGKLDLAVVNFNDNTVSILLGNGDGTFQPHVDYATGNHPQGVAVGDFNGDGKLDLAVANNADNTVSILLGNGDGTFGTHTDFATANVPNWVTVADFNGDGKLDIAAATSSSLVSILLGNGDGTFGKHTDFATGNFPYQVAVGDFNGDGKLDLATPNFNDGTISVLLGNGNGTFGTQAIFAAGTNAVSAYPGDFNGSGKLALAVANEAAGSVSVELQTVPQTPPTLSPTSLTFAQQEPGTSSAPKTLTLTNKSTSTLTINSITIGGVAASSYSQTNTCGTSVAGNGTCTISVTFTPTQSSASLNAQVTILDSAGTQLVTLTGSAKALISLSAIKMAFPTTPVGQTSTAKVATVTNQSGINISITSLSVTGNFVSDFVMTTTCGSTLAPFGTCTITVSFAPQASGGKSATVIMRSSAFDNFRGISLSGTGTGVVITPTSLTFPSQTVGTQSSPLTVTFNNVGIGTLTPAFAFTGTNATEFAQTNTCGSSSAPGTSCTISVTFTPAATGTRTATLTITESDPTSPQNVTLTGPGK